MLSVGLSILACCRDDVGVVSCFIGELHTAASPSFVITASCDDTFGWARTNVSQEDAVEMALVTQPRRVSCDIDEAWVKSDPGVDANGHGKSLSGGMSDCSENGRVCASQLVGWLWAGTSDELAAGAPRA